MDRISNEAVHLVKEIFETRSVEDLAAKLATGEWIAFAAVPDKDGYLFVLGRVKKTNPFSQHVESISGTVQLPTGSNAEDDPILI